VTKTIIDATVVAADAAIVDGEARGPTAVLAVGGEIARVGDPEEIAADPRAAGARRVDWSGRALIPGTVNAHNHGFQSLLRGIGDDLPFLVWRERALYRHGANLGSRSRLTNTWAASKSSVTRSAPASHTCQTYSP